MKWVIEIEGGAALPLNIASTCRVAASKFGDRGASGLSSLMERLAEAAGAAREAEPPPPPEKPDPDRTSVPVMMPNADFDKAVAASVNRLRVWADDAGHVSAHPR